MFSITKDFAFSASHTLQHLPPDHQCARLHGHNYLVRIELESEMLDSIGFVLDYGALKAFSAVVDSLDHRHLNDLLPFNPTAEKLARYLHGEAVAILPRFVTVSGVGISETPKTWAWYRP